MKSSLKDGDEWYDFSGVFPTCRCRECGLIYLNPRPVPAEIGQYYPEEYAPYQIAIEDEPNKWQRLNRRYALYKRIKVIQSRTASPGRVLDVGCATGTFLAALRQVGWQVKGVEFSLYAADYARQRFGIDVVTGELEQANFPDKHFDLVTFWDVLEHVPDPKSSLIEAARITKGGGQLLLVLPNPDSFEAGWFGQYWAGWDTPRHLHIFTKDVIKQFLEKTGWQMTEMICITGRIWLFNLSLTHWLDNHIDNPRWRKWIMTIASSLPVRLFSLPYFMLIERMKKGSIMAIFAQRTRH